MSGNDLESVSMDVPVPFLEECNGFQLVVVMMDRHQKITPAILQSLTTLLHIESLIIDK